MPISRAKNSEDGRSFPISRLFPNMVTLAGLCCGLSSVRFAMLERWEIAVAMIVIAAVLDALDGAVARMLKATSEFGAQLDSLADIVSFGIAPALVMYLWALQDIKRGGWSVALFFVVCCALRLARFNTAMHEPNTSTKETELTQFKKKNYFTGVPAPAGAMLGIWPLVISLEGTEFFKTTPILSLIYLVLIGGLMVSRIPTFSLKKIRITSDYILPSMLIAGTFITTLIVEPWHTLAVTGIIYLCSIIFSAWLASKQLTLGGWVSRSKNKESS
jgi:CDP-diacylglycerol--serine O-phosphatidyltransferase